MQKATITPERRCTLTGLGTPVQFVILGNQKLTLFDPDQIARTTTLHATGENVKVEGRICTIRDKEWFLVNGQQPRGLSLLALRRQWDNAIIDDVKIETDGKWNELFTD